VGVLPVWRLTLVEAPLVVVYAASAAPAPMEKVQLAGAAPVASRRASARLKVSDLSAAALACSSPDAGRHACHCTLCSGKRTPAATAAAAADECRDKTRLYEVAEAALPLVMSGTFAGIQAIIWLIVFE
jgi:hypothetical protein